MMLSKGSLFVVLLSLHETHAFYSPFSTSQHTIRGNFGVERHLATEGKNKQPLTSADILARARAAVGAPPEDEPPAAQMEYPFDESVLNDFERALKIIEQRVKNGPGSLSVDEINEFEAISNRVVSEMDEINGKRDAETTTKPRQQPPIVNQVVNTVPENSSSSSSQMPKSSSTTTATTAPTRPNLEESEGPGYDGRYGVARGTANTYIIPGMEEMSPEEYRAALQKSVIDRQSRRKESRWGIVGNRAAHDYLSTLGWGGTAQSLSHGKHTAEQDGDE